MSSITTRICLDELEDWWKLIQPEGKDQVIARDYQEADDSIEITVWRDPMRKVCGWCGERFDAKTTRARFCKGYCRTRAWRNGRKRTG